MLLNAFIYKRGTLFFLMSHYTLLLDESYLYKAQQAIENVRFATLCFRAKHFPLQTARYLYQTICGNPLNNPTGPYSNPMGPYPLLRVTVTHDQTQIELHVKQHNFWVTLFVWPKGMLLERRTFSPTFGFEWTEPPVPGDGSFGSLQPQQQTLGMRLVAGYLDSRTLFRCRQVSRSVCQGV